MIWPTRVFPRCSGRDGREKRAIDGDDADSLIFLLVALARAIAAAGLDFDVGFKGLLAVERADELVGVDDLDVGVGLDVGGSDGTLAIDLEVEFHRLAFFGDDQDLLQVEDDVRDILDHAIHRLELVGSPPRS